MNANSYNAGWERTGMTRQRREIIRTQRLIEFRANLSLCILFELKRLFTSLPLLCNEEYLINAAIKIS